MFTVTVRTGAGVLPAWRRCAFVRRGGKETAALEIKLNIRSCHLQTGIGGLFPRFFVSDGQGVTDSVAG